MWMLASKLSIVLQSKSHKARYLVKDWDLPRKVDYSVTEKSRKSQNRIAQGVGWKGRECREGRKAFCAPTWELTTEAAWPHLMFYSQSLPTLLQTFKLHFLLDWAVLIYTLTFQTGWFQFFATVNTAANPEVQISLQQDMESSGFKLRREIAGLYCGSVLSFWGPYKLMLTMATLTCTPSSAYGWFLSLPIFSNTDDRFLVDIHSDWDEVGMR